jgi:hypothetical protein
LGGEDIIVAEIKIAHQVAFLRIDDIPQRVESASGIIAAIVGIARTQCIEIIGGRIAKSIRCGVAIGAVGALGGHASGCGSGSRLRVIIIIWSRFPPEEGVCKAEKVTYFVGRDAHLQDRIIIDDDIIAIQARNRWGVETCRGSSGGDGAGIFQQEDIKGIILANHVIGKELLTTGALCVIVKGCVVDVGKLLEVKDETQILIVFVEQAQGFQGA